MSRALNGYEVVNTKLWCLSRVGIAWASPRWSLRIC